MADHFQPRGVLKGKGTVALPLRAPSHLCGGAVRDIRRGRRVTPFGGREGKNRGGRIYW
jgi:hypothetical protein